MNWILSVIRQRETDFPEFGRPKLGCKPVTLVLKISELLIALSRSR